MISLSLVESLLLHRDDGLKRPTNPTAVRIGAIGSPPVANESTMGSSTLCLILSPHGDPSHEFHLKLIRLPLAENHDLAHLRWQWLTIHLVDQHDIFCQG